MQRSELSPWNDALPLVTIIFLKKEGARAECTARWSSCHDNAVAFCEKQFKFKNDTSEILLFQVCINTQITIWHKNKIDAIKKNHMLQCL